MSDLHPALVATIHALRDGVTINDILDSLSDPIWASIIAVSAPERSIWSIAALACEQTALLTDDERLHPLVQRTIGQCIGTPEGGAILQSWAYIAPPEWGAMYAQELSNAVRRKTCERKVAAALVGPCDDAIAWMDSPSDIAFAVRRWGQSRPDHPTWWVDQLPESLRMHVFDVLGGSHAYFASCLPWLPNSVWDANEIADDALSFALRAFADASPVAYAMHADAARRLIERSHASHLEFVTRIACATSSAAAWRRVQRLLADNGDCADIIVMQTPWRMIPRTIRRMILDHADHSTVCAAIARARGRAMPVALTPTTAAAFFAALNPVVWKKLDMLVQRRWLAVLHPGHVHLAVRTLGMHPDILTHAHALSNDLIKAARAHGIDTATLRAMLFPLATHAIAPGEAYALLAALPHMPPDPAMFVSIARRGFTGKPFTVTHAPILQSPDDLAAAVVLQRALCANDAIDERCAALSMALHGRTRDNVRSLAGALGDDINAIIADDPKAFNAMLGGRLADTPLRDAFDRMKTLPLDIAVPARSAFVDLFRATSAKRRIAAATALAQTLHDHGDIIQALIRAMSDAPQSVWLHVLSLAEPEHDWIFERSIARAISYHPMILPALMSLAHESLDQQDHGTLLLAESPHIVRILLPLFRADVRERLLDCRSIAVAVADLAIPATLAKGERPKAGRISS